jgi:ribosomal protein S18 acetylase RimI-like enzyme
MPNILHAETQEQVEAARTLFREYAEWLGVDLCFQGFEEELANLPGDYAPPGGCILLAVEGEEAVGCVAVRDWGGGICEMKRMYVKPARRGRGIGRALAEALIEEARNLGYTRMRLDTIPSLAAANSLYVSLGFRKIEPYRYNPLDGATFMELELL